MTLLLSVKVKLLGVGLLIAYVLLVLLELTGRISIVFLTAFRGCVVIELRSSDI